MHCKMWTAGFGNDVLYNSLLNFVVLSLIVPLFRIALILYMKSRACIQTRLLCFTFYIMVYLATILPISRTPPLRSACPRLSFTPFRYSPFSWFNKTARVVFLVLASCLLQLNLYNKYDFLLRDFYQNTDKLHIKHIV